MFWGVIFLWFAFYLLFNDNIPGKGVRRGSVLVKVSLNYTVRVFFPKVDCKGNKNGKA